MEQAGATGNREGGLGFWPLGTDLEPSRIT